MSMVLLFMLLIVVVLRVLCVLIILLCVVGFKVPLVLRERVILRVRRICVILLSRSVSRLCLLMLVSGML